MCNAQLHKLTLYIHTGDYKITLLLYKPLVATTVKELEWNSTCKYFKACTRERWEHKASLHGYGYSLKKLMTTPTFLYC